MKKFYSVKLKEFKENIPVELAESMLKDESNLISYLDDNNALDFKHIKSRNRLDLYADEKYLMLGKMKYPTIFQDRGNMGFMELYIAREIKRNMQLAKGST